jgi:hypothetical protein
VGFTFDHPGNNQGDRKAKSQDRKYRLTYPRWQGVDLGEHVYDLGNAPRNNNVSRTYPVDVASS